MTDKITYYVTSSVLGGELVTELSEQGTKERTLIHAGGGALASQKITAGVSSVEWEHWDASGASYRVTDVNGQWAIGKELDPLGSNAGLIKPPTWNVPSKNGLTLPHPVIADMLNNPGGGCEADGMPIPCEMLKSLTEAGGVEVNYSFRDGQRWRREGAPIVSHGLGIFVTEHPYLRPNNEWRPGDPLYEVHWRHSVFTFAPQNTQSQQDTRTDCRKFADIVDEIAKAVFIDNRNPSTNSYPHNLNYFMDTLAQRFTGIRSATLWSAALQTQGHGVPGFNAREFGSRAFGIHFMRSHPATIRSCMQLAV